MKKARNLYPVVGTLLKVYLTRPRLVVTFSWR